MTYVTVVLEHHLQELPSMSWHVKYTQIFCVSVPPSPPAYPQNALYRRVDQSMSNNCIKTCQIYLALYQNAPFRYLFFKIIWRICHMPHSYYRMLTRFVLVWIRPWHYNVNPSDENYLMSRTELSGAHAFCPFLRQFWADFLEILHRTFLSHVLTSVKIIFNISKIRPLTYNKIPELV